MTRFSFNLMAGLAVCSTLLSASLAMADKKGPNAAARRSLSSSSSSSASFKKLSTGGASNSMSQNLGNSGLNFKKGSLNQGTSSGLANAVKNGSLAPINRNLGIANGVTNNSGLLLGNKNLITDRGRIADLVKNGKLSPIGGTGAGGNTGGKRPIDSIIADPGRLADMIKDGELKPIDDNPPVADPGNNPPASPPADPPHCPPKHDCHPCFPWYPVFIGGTYNWCPTPIYTGVTVVQQPVVQTVVAAPAVTASVDLVLVDVRLVDAGDAARKLGPRFRLFFQNRGTLTVDNFQVVIMATKEAKPAADAPTASAEVARLAAGEMGSADVRLPASADLSALPMLLAGIDSAMQIDELDEANNVAALERAKIAAAE